MDLGGRTPLEGRLERRRKLLARTLDALNGAVIVVEGKHDTDALRRIGVKGRIVALNGRVKGVCEKVEEAREAREKVGEVGGVGGAGADAEKADSVVVLTDSDAAGEELAVRVAEELEGCNLKPEMQARRDLRYALGVKRIEEIEGKMMEFEEKLRKAKIAKGD